MKKRSSTVSPELDEERKSNISFINPPSLVVSDEKEKTDETVDAETGKSKSAKKHPGFRDNLYQYFAEYCGYSTLHGVPYLGENRTILEK